MCLCLFICLYLAIYLSICVMSVCLSILFYSILSIYLSICLLSACLSIYLSIYLSENKSILQDFRPVWKLKAAKRGFSARLSTNNLEVESSKTKLFCEMSYKFGSCKLNNEASFCETSCKSDMSLISSTAQLQYDLQISAAITAPATKKWGQKRSAAPVKIRLESSINHKIIQFHT